MRITVSRRSRLGQSLAEFALILPILMLLMTGSIDLARAFYTKVTIANAARAAAEVGVNWDLARQVGSTTATNRVQQRAIAEAGTFVPLTTSDVALQYFDGSAWQSGLSWQQGTRFSVTVTARFAPVTPVVGQLLGSTPFSMTHRVEMRHSCTAATASCTY